MKPDCVFCKNWNTNKHIPLGCTHYEYYKCESCIHKVKNSNGKWICDIREESINEITSCNNHNFGNEKTF